MKKNFLPLIMLLLVLPLVAAQCGASQQSSGPDIKVVDPYARAAIPNGAVFMQLVNQGSVDDSLIGVKTDVANAAELHESKMDANGVMSMSPVASIPVPAGGSVTLEPGGLHVMLIGLKRDMAVGDKFNLTLDFEKSGSRTVEVEVRDSMTGQSSQGEGEMKGIVQK